MGGTFGAAETPISSASAARSASSTGSTKLARPWLAAQWRRVDAGALPWPLLPAGECIRATALGASYNVARGLSALAPLIIGTVGQKHGLSGAFLLCGIAFALASASAAFLPETQGTEIT